MRTLNEVPRRLVIAIGGNAVHPEDIRGTSQEQKAVAQQTAEALLPLAQIDNELVITHGNGPVVGKIMMRQMLTMKRIPPMDMDICVAHSQGGIGYLLMQAIENALREQGNPRHVASLLTQVEVDKDDPAFQNPTKFVGPFFSERGSQENQRRTGLGDAGKTSDGAGATSCRLRNLDMSATFRWSTRWSSEARSLSRAAVVAFR